MSVLYRVSLEPTSAELLTLFGAGALIRWEYSADGISYSEGGTEAIISGTETYTIEYLAGTAATYLRSRYSKASPSVSADYSAYSDVVQGGAFTAYAGITDLTETLALGGSATHTNLLADMLVDVTADIDVMCGRTFLRVPQVSGTTTVYVDICNSGCDSLVDAAGSCYTTDGRALDIISVTTLSYRESETSSYVAIAAGDTGYYLESGYGPGTAGTVWPYEDITLSPSSATRTTFPTGKRAVKIIGALGFPAIPAPVKRATISEVRERFRQSIGGGPTQAGVNQFGTPIFLTGDSPDMRRLRTIGGPFVKRNWRLT